jgi:fumarate hydratase class II
MALMKAKTRKEKDVFGTLEVPRNTYWGINTQRAIQNFQISGRRFPKSFVLALAKVKKACVKANFELGALDKEKYRALLAAIEEVQEEKYLDQFPLDVFQTGSGTQINMNMNEVLANRANEILGYPLGKKHPIHPNDHVNKSQSSNDVIPTAMHLSALELLDARLFPALEKLRKILRQKRREFKGIVKVGRTHLQDAVPIHLSMEFEVYQRQVAASQMRLRNACKGLYFVPIGGTALGTGIDADKNFGRLVVAHLRSDTGFHFQLNPVKAEGIASHAAIVETSGALRSLALSALKMANDIRWMGSGPRAGLGELILPPNELGSSIMPGKVNPTQAEALIQICMQVVGNDTTISLAEGFGSILDLNVAKPLMIVNLLDSINILANGINSFVDKCLKDLRANIEQINAQLERNLMVATKLVPILGYDKASEIAEKASSSGKTIKEVVLEMRLKIKGNLDELLDPKKMA